MKKYIMRVTVPGGTTTDIVSQGVEQGGLSLLWRQMIKSRKYGSFGTTFLRAEIFHGEDTKTGEKLLDLTGDEMGNLIDHISSGGEVSAMPEVLPKCEDSTVAKAVDFMLMVVMPKGNC